MDDATRDAAIAVMRKRRDGMRQWLEDEAPFTFADQRHLDANTPERAYWHHGYMMALDDVLERLLPNTSVE